MNREFLTEMGLTKEQIDHIMAEHGKSISAEKSKAEGYKTDSLKLTELTKQLETLKAAQAEKDKSIETKDTQYDELAKKFTELQAELKTKELKASLAEKGITGENADKLIASLNGSTIDVEVLANIITERETGAVDKKVKELEGLASNPNGGKAKSEEKSDIEVMAQNIGKSLAQANKTSNDVLAQYM